MKIVIRTRTPHIFLFGFKSFLNFYEDELKNLIVFVQKERENKEFFDTLSKIYKFQVEYIDEAPFENYWAYMLYKSLQFDEVVSLDDDIVYFRPGLFNKIREISKNSNKNLFGFKNIINDKSIINSSLIYKKNINITENDFIHSLSDVLQKYNGVDTGYLSEKYIDKIEFLNNYILNERGFNNSIQNNLLNYYFIHVGGISCTLNEINGFKIGNN